jgi:quercetin dioxygenase-like cupin family protein
VRSAAIWLVAGMLSVGLLSTARAQDAAPTASGPVVPVYHEPHHRQVFQYGPTRILDLQISPGETTWFHSHESPVLYVNLSTSPMRGQNLGEEWASPGRGNAPARGTPPPSTAPPGSPRVSSTTSYAEQPVTHRLQNTGTGLVRAIVVINETAGDDSTSEEGAGFAVKAELTNRWFRAYRISLAPGEKAPAHRHGAPVAIVQTLGGKGLAVGPMKFELNEPGQWAFFDAGTEHEIRNIGTTRLEFVEVEVRRK